MKRGRKTGSRPPRSLSAGAHGKQRPEVARLRPAEWGRHHPKPDAEVLEIRGALVAIRAAHGVRIAVERAAIASSSRPG